MLVVKTTNLARHVTSKKSIGYNSVRVLKRPHSPNLYRTGLIYISTLYLSATTMPIDAREDFRSRGMYIVQCVECMYNYEVGSCRLNRNGVYSARCRVHVLVQL